MFSYGCTNVSLEVFHPQNISLVLKLLLALVAPSQRNKNTTMEVVLFAREEGHLHDCRFPCQMEVNLGQYQVFKQIRNERRETMSDSGLDMQPTTTGFHPHRTQQSRIRRRTDSRQK